MSNLNLFKKSSYVRNPYQDDEEEKPGNFFTNSVESIKQSLPTAQDLAPDEVNQTTNWYGKAKDAFNNFMPQEQQLNQESVNQTSQQPDWERYNPGTGAPPSGQNNYEEVRQPQAPVQTQQMTPDVTSTTSEIFGENDPDDPNNENATPHGNLYDQNVLAGLQGEHADVTSARNEAERDSKFQTYYDTKEAKERAAAGGIDVGSREYQRMMDYARAGTDTANLNRENAVNQMQRNYYNDAMNRAEGVEDKHWSRNEIAKLETKQDWEGFIADQPNRVQNELKILLANGDMDGLAARADELYTDGTLQEGYIRTPDEANMDAALGYFKPLYPKKPGQSDEEWKATPIDTDGDGQPDTTIGEAAIDRYAQIGDSIINPLDDNEYNREKELDERTLKDAINSGKEVTPEMVIKGMEGQSESDIHSGLRNGELKKGQYMNIDGKAIKIVDFGSFERQGQERTNQYVKIEYPLNSGTYYYTDITSSGQSQWYSEEPMDNADVGYNGRAPDPRIESPFK